MKQNPEKFVKSADRAFDLLEFVADAREPPSFSELLSGLDIPRSSLFHLLNNLLARGYLEQDSVDSRYRLGGRVRKLADRIRGPSLEVIVTPFLRRLSVELNETSGFYVRAGDAVEAIASVPSSQALAYTMKVGERAPLYAISGGKIVLTQMRRDELKSYLLRVRFEAFTPRTITSISRLRQEIVAARRDGYAYSREEFTPGITGIAIAILDRSRFIGALNLVIPTARLGHEQEARSKRCMQTVAAALSQALQGFMPA